MADMSAPSGQAPAVAPPVRTDDEILPYNRWVQIGKSNCSLNLDKKQSNPIFKIAVDLLMHTNFHRAFTASTTVPTIYIQQRHKFYPRPDSALHLANNGPVLGYLKFSAKGTKREVFRMPIPGRLITADIREASYYQEYQENVAKHRGFLAGDTWSTQDLPAPKPAKPTRKPKSTAQKAPPKPSISSPAVEESLKTAHAVHRDSEEESKKVLTEAFEGGNDDVQTGLDPDVQDEGQKETDADTLNEGQAGSNPDKRSEGQAGPDPGITGNEEQSILNLVVHAGSDRKHIDLDVTKASPQPSTEQLDEGFLATAYPKIQESLKLAVEEQVLLEEPASSSGTLSSLHHLSKDISFGDQFFSNKPLDVDKNAETEVESMVSIAVSEVVTDAIDWAMQAPLRNRFRDLPEADMKEILHQRMWETESYKTHEDHSLLFEALENSMNCDHSKELAQDLAKARKKKRKRHESPKTLPGSPPHQPPPPPPPTGPSGPSKALRASGSQVTPPPPPPPPPSTSQDNLDMDEAIGPNEQAQLLDDEDIRSGHISTTDDMATFIDWFCKRRGITELKPQDLEGPAFEIIKMVPDQFWINEECKYDIASMYGISHWWFQRQRFYIDRHTSEGDRNTVRTHMRILSVVRIEIFSRYGYDYMKKIVLRHADLNEHIIAERDFKYLYPSDFEDLYMLNLQGHLNHLPPKTKGFSLRRSTNGSDNCYTKTRRRLLAWD
nr:hypothetical protein [Tanacetum cinerariifolium]